MKKMFIILMLVVFTLTTGFTIETKKETGFMSYIIESDISKRMGSEKLQNSLSIIGETTPEMAIKDACAEIDGFLASRYITPIEKVPDNIKKYAVDIAIYNLLSQVGLNPTSENKADEQIIKRYENAINYLNKVAEGKIDLPLPPLDDGSPAGFSGGNIKTVTHKKLDLSWFV